MSKIYLDGHGIDPGALENIVNGPDTAVIRLNIPVANINEWDGRAKSPYAVVLGLTQEELKQIIDYELLVLFNKDNGSFRTATEKDYMTAREEGENIECLTGVSAIARMIDAVSVEDIEKMQRSAAKTRMECLDKMETLNQEYDAADVTPEEATDEICDKLVGNLEEFTSVENRFNQAQMEMDSAIYIHKYGTSRLVMNEVRLFPREVKTIIAEEAGKVPLVAYSHLSSLCSRIDFANSRLGKFIAHEVPDIILKDSKKLVQKRVDELLSSGSTGDGHFAYMSLGDIVLRNMPV